MGLGGFQLVFVGFLVMFLPYREGLEGGWFYIGFADLAWFWVMF